ncbi:galactoside alpha-(1,2)-fucosyltransferase 2-like [Haliotis cracherodii]|uniref:galactoside alpha-(1,2)-fucosyltransferase 2-like n=1 Tax=Haliotis cracherodii TaxID=6455 RepID=UPI0039E7BCB7
MQKVYYHGFLLFSLITLIILWCSYHMLFNWKITKAFSGNNETNFDNWTGKIISLYNIQMNTTTCPFNFSIPDETINKVLTRWRTTEPRENLLTTSSGGRLGNHMFRYGSLLGIAFLTGKHPLLENTDILTKLFNISFIGIVSKKTRIFHKEVKYASYGCDHYNLPDGTVQLIGNRQSWKYFYSVRSEVRKEFTLVQTYRDLSAQCFQKYTSRHENRTVIGLHVRRTDVTWNSKQGYTAAPLSYIRKAINHMKTKFQNPIFLTATDDKNWCRENLQSSDVILMENTDPYLDFATLTLCDHMIMTVGTFGWWAAWLVNGYTVYYKDYPIAGSPLASAFNKEDFFMPDWVPLGA